MYYFAFCTWLDDEVLSGYLPEAKLIAKGYAVNHKLRFYAIKGKEDRGWCNLDDTNTAYGHKTMGIIYEHDFEYYDKDYPGFERCFLTVYGEDGKTYDCWAYRLADPGIAMNPPDFYYNYIIEGLKKHDFPKDYIEEVKTTLESEEVCPRANRPDLSAISES